MTMTAAKLVMCPLLIVLASVAMIHGAESVVEKSSAPVHSVSAGRRAAVSSSAWEPLRRSEPAKADALLPAASRQEEDEFASELLSSSSSTTTTTTKKPYKPRTTAKPKDPVQDIYKMHEMQHLMHAPSTKRKTSSSSSSSSSASLPSSMASSQNYYAMDTGYGPALAAHYASPVPAPSSASSASSSSSSSALSSTLNGYRKILLSKPSQIRKLIDNRLGGQGSRGEALAGLERGWMDGVHLALQSEASQVPHHLHPVPRDSTISYPVSSSAERRSDSSHEEVDESAAARPSRELHLQDEAALLPSVREAVHSKPAVGTRRRREQRRRKAASPSAHLPSAASPPRRSTRKLSNGQHINVPSNQLPLLPLESSHSLESVIDAELPHDGRPLRRRRISEDVESVGTADSRALSGLEGDEIELSDEELDEGDLTLGNGNSHGNKELNASGNRNSLKKLTDTKEKDKSLIMYVNNHTLNPANSNDTVILVVNNAKRYNKLIMVLGKKQTREAHLKAAITSSKLVT